MFKRIIALGILILAVPLVSGCWFLIGAGAGGATVYEVTAGTVTANYDTRFDRAYQVALAILRSKKGTIKMEDSAGGWLKADIGEEDVAIHIEKLTERAIKVTVSARKEVLPDGKFAHNIMNEISDRLR